MEKKFSSNKPSYINKIFLCKNMHAPKVFSTQIEKKIGKSFSPFSGLHMLIGYFHYKMWMWLKNNK